MRSYFFFKLFMVRSPIYFNSLAKFKGVYAERAFKRLQNGNLESEEGFGGRLSNFLGRQTVDQKRPLSDHIQSTALCYCSRKLPSVRLNERLLIVQPTVASQLESQTKRTRLAIYSRRRRIWKEQKRSDGKHGSVSAGNRRIHKINQTKLLHSLPSERERT